MKETDEQRRARIGAMSREQAVEYFSAEQARIIADLKSLPVFEQLRAAADFAQRGDYDWAHAMAEYTLERIAKMLPRSPAKVLKFPVDP